MKLVSDAVYLWILYIGIAGISIGWGARDVYLLFKTWGKPGPIARDQIFGSIMGLAICTIGIVGLIRYVRSH